LEERDILLLGVVSRQVESISTSYIRGSLVPVFIWE